MGPGKAFGAYFDDWRAVEGASTLSDSVPLPLEAHCSWCWVERLVQDDRREDEGGGDNGPIVGLI